MAAFPLSSSRNTEVFRRSTHTFPPDGTKTARGRNKAHNYRDHIYECKCAWLYPFINHVAVICRPRRCRHGCPAFYHNLNRSLSPLIPKGIWLRLSRKLKLYWVASQMCINGTHCAPRSFFKSRRARLTDVCNVAMCTGIGIYIIG